MTYNTESFTVAIDINWVLGFLSLLTLVATTIVIDHYDDYITLPSWRSFAAAHAVPVVVLAFGATAAGTPLTVAFISVIGGPLFFAWALGAAAAVYITAAEMYSNSRDHAKAYAVLTYRTLSTYGATLRKQLDARMSDRR